MVDVEMGSCSDDGSSSPSPPATPLTATAISGREISSRGGARNVGNRGGARNVGTRGGGVGAPSLVRASSMMESRRLECGLRGVGWRENPSRAHRADEAREHR